MNQGAVRSWLDAYGRAWETRDPQAAGDLFADDATYRETPFEEPIKGRSGIIEYWSNATRSQGEIRFRNEILAVTDIGIAHWWVSYVRIPSKTQVKLDGIFVFSLNAENRCKEFQEWWRSQTTPV